MNRFCFRFLRALLAVALMTSAVSCGGFETGNLDEDTDVSVEEAADNFSQEELTANQTWWNGLAQVSKDATILVRAYKDLGKTTTTNCKQWVQKVVNEATKGVLVVPATANGGDSFYWTQSNNWRSFTASSCYWPQNLKPGMIVQMQSTRCTFPGATSTGPHTAIVSAADANGVWLIESNWCATNTICERYLTTTDFRKWFVDCTGLSRCTAYRAGNWQ